MTMLCYREQNPFGPFDEPCYLRMLAKLRESIPNAQFEDYFIQQMRILNGGNPSRHTFDTRSERERVLELVYCYTPVPSGPGPDWDDVPFANVYVANSLLREGAFPEELYPIGRLFAGDELCFDFGARAVSPPVVVWRHELYATSNAIDFVAESFREFCELLH